MEESKTLKQYAKEAKNRLKTGFWQEHKKKLDEDLIKAKENGVAASRVTEYYSRLAVENVKNVNDDEEFYKKVKKLLDEEGEVPDAIGRLTDKNVYASLSYDEKQRYWMSVSEKYLKAVERYNREKSVCFTSETGS
ncbi:MAG TPA: hypothetical protein DEV87_06160 [Clostridiales bacterium]|nr:hypothetical protein [Clostridiales bacterium]